MRNTTRWAILGGLLTLAAVAYWFFSPYWTLWGLRDALVTADSVALEAQIDFPVLRQNLKDQVNAQFMAEAGEDLQDNPFSVLAMGLATGLVDKIVDGLVTPAGLARLTAGIEPTVNAEAVSDPAPVELDSSSNLLEHATIRRNSLSSFSVHVRDPKKEEEIQLLFRRDGLRWVLINIVLPVTHFVQLGIENCSR